METDNRRRIIEQLLNHELTLDEARAEARKAETVIFHLQPPGEYGYFYGPDTPFSLEHTGQRMTLPEFEKLSKKYGTAVIIEGPEWTKN
jgi:hypothetical protein